MVQVFLFFSSWSERGGFGTWTSGIWDPQVAGVYHPGNGRNMFQQYSLCSRGCFRLWLFSWCPTSPLCLGVWFLDFLKNTSLFGAMIRKKQVAGLQGLWRGFVPGLCVVRISGLRTANRNKLGAWGFFFCSKMRVVNQMYHFCFLNKRLNSTLPLCYVFSIAKKHDEIFWRVIFLLITFLLDILTGHLVAGGFHSWKFVGNPLRTETDIWNNPCCILNPAMTLITQAECSTSTPWKINMEPKNGGLEYEFPFQPRDF